LGRERERSEGLYLALAEEVIRWRENGRVGNDAYAGGGTKKVTFEDISDFEETSIGIMGSDWMAAQQQQRPRW
jgi:hypothetical protein